MKYKIMAKYNGKGFGPKSKNERYEAVTRGSGDGGGVRYFSSKAAAQSYARSLTSFDTKIVQVQQNTRSRNVFGGFGF